MLVIFFDRRAYPRALPVLTHSFPTRRSSVLPPPPECRLSLGFGRLAARSQKPRQIQQLAPARPWPCPCPALRRRPPARHALRHAQDPDALRPGPPCQTRPRITIAGDNPRKRPLANWWGVRLALPRKLHGAVAWPG